MAQLSYGLYLDLVESGQMDELFALHGGHCACAGCETDASEQSVLGEGGEYAEAGITAVSATGDQNLDALLRGNAWTDSNLTYSWPADASYYGAPGQYSASNEHDNNFEQMNAAQRATINMLLAEMEDFTGLSFTKMQETADDHAVLRYGMSDDPSTAWGYYPWTSETGGDMWFNNSSGTYDNPVLGGYAYHTFIHETGHALGLKHGHDTSIFGAMDADRDGMEFSVMTYRSYIGHDLGSYGYYTNSSGHYAQSLMMYDIAALQHMYGPDFITNADDTTYTFDETTGEMFINGVGQGEPTENVIFRTIWDGGGSDWYDFSNYTQDQDIDLTPGGWSAFSDSQLAWINRWGDQAFDTHARANVFNALQYQGDDRSLIENAKGGSGSDTITGNAADNILVGAAGDDRLAGGVGDDTLRGGAGIDTADFTADTGGVYVNLKKETATDGTGGTDALEQIENVDGSDFADEIRGSNDDNVITGQDGDDSLYGGKGNDDLQGMDGADEIRGGGGDDTITGGIGKDVLFGGGGDDFITGGSDTDRLYGGVGTDTVIVSGNRADYTVIDLGGGDIKLRDDVGGEGNDRLYDMEFVQFADQTVSIADLLGPAQPGEPQDLPSNPLPGTFDEPIVSGENPGEHSVAIVPSISGENPGEHSVAILPGVSGENPGEEWVADVPIMSGENPGENAVADTPRMSGETPADTVDGSGLFDFSGFLGLIEDRLAALSHADPRYGLVLMDGDPAEGVNFGAVPLGELTAMQDDSAFGANLVQYDPPQSTGSGWDFNDDVFDWSFDGQRYPALGDAEEMRTDILI